MKYNFDAYLDRRGTGSMKWDRNFRGESVIERTDINSLWVADMDFPCANPIVEALKARAEHPAYGYTGIEGSDFFKSIADWNKNRYGRSVNENDILYSPGVVFSIACAVNAFTKPGDGIIIQTPVYYPFKRTIEKNYRTVVENPLIKSGNSYVMDFDNLSLSASDENVKMIILCSPHNPVGRVWNKAELKRLNDICFQNDVLIVADEIHSDLLRAGVDFVPAAKVGNPDNVVTVNAPSKTFNIPGLMSSWVIIENDSLKTRWKDEAYGRSGMSIPNPFGLNASIAAYTQCDDWLVQVKDYIDRNLAWMKIYIEKNIPDIGYEIPEGTYLAWLDFNKTIYGDDIKLTDLLDENKGILVDPGSIFGLSGRGFIRINAACPHSRLEDALNKIKNLINT